MVRKGFILVALVALVQFSLHLYKEYKQEIREARYDALWPAEEVLRKIRGEHYISVPDNDTTWDVGHSICFARVSNTLMVFFQTVEINETLSIDEKNALRAEVITLGQNMYTNKDAGQFTTFLTKKTIELNGLANEAAEARSRAKWIKNILFGAGYLVGAGLIVLGFKREKSVA